MKRFSKQTLAEDLEQRMDAIQKKRNFDLHNGWVQVQGKGEEINRDYGALDALRTLYHAYSLNDLKPTKK